jgi:hypothetical protein
MNGVRTKCENPACINPTNTVATYRHVHGAVAKTWTAAAYGATEDSAPHPTPCPNDGTPCPPVSIKCNSCGWTKQYPPS